MHLADIETISSVTGEFNAIIETPKGYRNKYKYDPRLDQVLLDGVLPPGAVFPYDFGFLPGTRGEDGDPLDILVLLDEPVFTGCIVPVRLVGVIEAEQTERDGTTVRNDRLIGVSVTSHEYRNITELAHLPRSLVEEISYFFQSYNQTRGKEFLPIARRGVAGAEKLVKRGIRNYQKSKSQ